MTSPDNKELSAYQKAMGQKVGDWGMDGDVISGILGRIPFLGDVIGALQGLITSGPFAFVSGLMSLRWLQVDRVQLTADLAIAEAKRVDGRVDALITGGTRTLHTSNFTYTKPANLVSLTVIAIGAGGSGMNGQPPGSGAAMGGGYACSEEFPAAVVPATVEGIVPSGANGGSGSTGNIQAKFGNLLSSPPSNTGLLVEPRGLGDLSKSCPGQGAHAAYPGGSSSYAAGGGVGNPGGAGANAPTSGTALCGGGAGGGGQSVPYSGGFTVISGGPGVGGPGGFPGGPGGAGGRDSLSGAPGGPGAPALIALIEKLGPEVTP